MFGIYLPSNFFLIYFVVFDPAICYRMVDLGLDIFNPAICLESAENIH